MKECKSDIVTEMILITNYHHVIRAFLLGFLLGLSFVAILCRKQRKNGKTVFLPGCYYLSILHIGLNEILIPVYM